MAAAISSTGTWSSLTDKRTPVEHANGNVDQRFDGASLNYPTQRVADANLYPEMMQFIALASQGTGLRAGIIIVRLRDILDSLESTADAGEQRVYPTA